MKVEITRIAFNHCTSDALLSATFWLDDNETIDLDGMTAEYNLNGYLNIEFPQFETMIWPSSGMKAYTLSFSLREMLRDALAEYLKEHPSLDEALKGSRRFISQNNN